MVELSGSVSGNAAPGLWLPCLFWFSFTLFNSKETFVGPGRVGVTCNSLKKFSWSSAAVWVIAFHRVVR